MRIVVCPLPQFSFYCKSFVIVFLRIKLIEQYELHSITKISMSSEQKEYQEFFPFLHSLWDSQARTHRFQSVVKHFKLGDWGIGIVKLCNIAVHQLISKETLLKFMTVLNCLIEVWQSLLQFVPFYLFGLPIFLFIKFEHSIEPCYTQKNRKPMGWPKPILVLLLLHCEGFGHVAETILFLFY